MHIPDGFLSPPVFISGWAAALAGLSYFLKKTSQTLKEKAVPLIGVMAAFIFAAQMLNFPVLGGTSGHLLGGLLAAITAGPCAAVVILSLVLFVQCLIFQDGGLTALGVNIFNMAFAGAWGGYYMCLFFRRVIFRKNPLPAVFVSAWASVMLVSFLCGLELALSGTSPFKVVMPAMLLVHFFIGIGEALITVFIISFIIKVRPDLIYGGGL